jgi:FAD:protein FMN transferase
LVEIACQGLAGAQAHHAIDAAFAAIDQVHRLMSFHAPDSDVTRLNQGAAAAPVEVDSRTAAVITLALEVAAASDGAFDITIAERLVAWGKLPRPPAAPTPDPAATWRDIELLPGSRVRFHRPLWIDLGGLAKGFAVDRAIERVAGEPTARWIVNAGGDLRVAGRGLEPVVLQTDQPSAAGAAVVELEDASLASSRNPAAEPGCPGEPAVGAHLDGCSRRRAGQAGFVSVVAQDCAVADALTKVVLVLGAAATPVLRRYGATAFLQGGGGAWQTLGEPA